jgi:hypothetical protein
MYPRCDYRHYRSEQKRILFCIFQSAIPEPEALHILIVASNSHYFFINVLSNSVYLLFK